MARIAPPMPPKSGQNKSAFVRSLPADMSAKEAVAKAKDAGLSISESYVHTIRSAAKRKEGKPNRRIIPSGILPGMEVGGGSRVGGSSGGSSSSQAEAQLMSLVIQHGLPAVEHMLASVAGKLRKLV